MYYWLMTNDLPDDLNPEGIATLLEKAANQVRKMSSIHSAHSMKLQSCGVKVTHGTSRNRLYMGDL